jgi:hypothetical protein
MLKKHKQHAPLKAAVMRQPDRKPGGSIRELFKHKHPPKLPNIQKQRALILQGHIGIMKYTDPSSPIVYLATQGIGPCIGLVLYNAAMKHAIMGHLDSEITRDKFILFKKRQNDPEYQKTDHYKQIINEYKKMAHLLTELTVIIKDREQSPIKISAIFTAYHDEKKGLGYPLKAIFDETCQELGLHYTEPLNPDNNYPKKDDENVSIHLPSGKVARYSGESEESSNAMNHMNEFEYYKIAPDGQLIKPEEPAPVKSSKAA